jgi:HAD superfamily hydrolase (TIGR01549 family)
MNKFTIISFDVEGTLVTTDFSAAIWFEGIPESYAKKYGMSFEQGRKAVMQEYEKVGDQRIEWYDINYWVNKFGIGSSYELLKRYRNKIGIYPEVTEVLQELSQQYRLIICSGTPREFLVHLLQDIEGYFTDIFSSTSDFKSVKNRNFYDGICRKMESAPEQIVHVGDNYQFDFQEPMQIGLQAYYLNRGDSEKKDNTIQSLLELKNLL